MPQQKSQLPSCARPGCPNRVREARRQFCSADCNVQAQIAARPSKPQTTDSVSITGNACEITKTVDHRVKTLADLITVCEIDTDTWEVERFLCNKWDQAAMPRTVGPKKIRTSTTPIITELYQVKVWLKRRVDIIAARAEVADLIKLAKVGVRKASTTATTYLRSPRSEHSDLMLEISIPDLHAGKMAWAKETGWDNYDIKIAKAVYEEALEKLLQRTSGQRYNRILLVTGNDLLNADNTAGTTTRGTPQDTEGRFQKTFAMVRTMLVTAIEQCRALAPVVVPMVPGNHDTLTVWHLGDSLECYFHKYADVTIDNAPTMRKYQQFGKVMLMFTHGDKGKHPDYPLVMATEQPKMFGETLHREAHIGHHHMTKVTEYHGVKVRISPALCAADAWHAENQYVGQARAAEAFVWHREEGQIASATYTVPQGSHQ